MGTEDDLSPTLFQIGECSQQYLLQTRVEEKLRFLVKYEQWTLCFSRVLSFVLSIREAKLPLAQICKRAKQAEDDDSFDAFAS
jgi:hypothetical protein